MDPNKTLEEIRRQCNAILNPTDFTYDVTELAELTMALDSWLSMGGFLPKPWDKQR